MSADFNKPLATQNTDDALEQIKANFISLAKMDLVDNNTAPVNSIAYHENKFKKKTNEGWVELPLTINPENISSNTIRAKVIQLAGENVPFEGPAYSIEMSGEAGTITAVGNITAPNITSLTQAVEQLGAARSILLGTSSVGGDLNIDTTSNASATIINIPDASEEVRGVLTTGTQSIGGEKTFLSHVQATDGLSVSGVTTLGLTDTEHLAVDGTLSVTGSSSLSGLSTQGATSVGGDLSVTGSSSLSSLSTTGNVSVGGDLSVTGSSSLSSLSTTGNVSVGGSLSVSGTSTVNTLISSSITSSGNISAINATLNGTLSVAGNTTLSSTTTGNTTVGGALSVSGTSALKTTTIIPTIFSAKALVVSGLATQTANLFEAQTSSGTILFSISKEGNASIIGAGGGVGGTLSVTGTSTLSGNTSIGGTLSVTGNTTVSSSIGIGTSSLNEKFCIQSIAGSSSGISLRGNNNSTANEFLVAQGGSGEAYVWQRNNSTISFGTNNTERLRLHADGIATFYGPRVIFNNPIEFPGSARAYRAGPFYDTTNWHLVHSSNSFANHNPIITATPSGSVGINMVSGTSPSNTLEVNGGVTCSGAVLATQFTSASGTNGIFTNTGSGGGSSIGSLLIKCSTTSQRVYFDNIVQSNSGVVLRLASSNGLVQETSSLRFKKDIEPIQPEYSDNLYNFRPVWYRANTEVTDDISSWSWFGFIAEELAQVEPRLVSFEYKKDDYENVLDENGNATERLKQGAIPTVPRGVHYDKITVLLVDLAQKQKKTIDSLEERIKKLEDLLVRTQG